MAAFDGICFDFLGLRRGVFKEGFIAENIARLVVRGLVFRVFLRALLRNGVLGLRHGFCLGGSSLFRSGRLGSSGFLDGFGFCFLIRNVSKAFQIAVSVWEGKTHSRGLKVGAAAVKVKHRVVHTGGFVGEKIGGRDSKQPGRRAGEWKAHSHEAQREESQMLLMDSEASIKEATSTVM